MIPVERIEEVAGLYFRSILIPMKDMVAIQHQHDHDHATLVASGRAEAYGDGILIGKYDAGSAVEIKAGIKHHFVALEDNTRLVCVHDIKSAESAKARS